MCYSSKCKLSLDQYNLHTQLQGHKQNSISCQLGLKRIFDYPMNNRIFGYSTWILSIRIIILKEMYDMNM